MKATTKQKGNVSSMQDEVMDKESMKGKFKKETPELTPEDEKKIQGMQDLTFGEGEEAKFLKQVEAEYTFATRGLDEWIDKNVKRLKLYNNQKRDDKLVGEPMLFTHMNTWLSSLYEDEFDKVWTPREEGDIRTAENLTNVAEYDSELMGKAELDYSADWDALFFSYSVIDMLEFDKDKKCPAPSIIDPLGFYYDTLSSSIDGNSVHKGGMRFLGWSMYMSEREVNDSPFMDAGALEKLNSKDKNSNTKKEEVRELRMEAIGGNKAQFDSTDMGDNNIFEILQWRTWYKGKKVVVLLTSDRENILGAKILPVDEEGKPISWWVSAKRFNPQPNQFKGMSLPDLLEDKQRKKATVINDLINLSKISTYGSHVYNKQQIKNTADLKWGYDKWIASDGDARSAIAPVYKDNGNFALINNILSYLDNSAQTASATPSLQQGVLSAEQRTLGELEMVSQSSKTRYSLALKTFAIGDVDFWSLYYASLKVNLGEGLGAKVVRISGSQNSFRKLNRDEIICKTDPDIKIISKSLSEATKLREFAQYMKVFEVIMLDPEADKRASEKRGLYLSGASQDVIDEILPPTSDEVIAREQNEMIAAGEKPQFLENDNHRVHIRIHKEAVENKMKQFHIMLHVTALKAQQINPALTPAPEVGMEAGQTAPAMPNSSGMKLPEVMGKPI